MSAQWWCPYTKSDNSVLDSDPGMSFKKIEDIKNPSEKFMFIDAQGQMRDGYFAIYCNSFSWWNIPSTNHSDGTVNGFADGHVEQYKFDKGTAQNARDSLANGGGFGMDRGPITEGEKEDLRYFQRATWGKTAG